MGDGRDEGSSAEEMTGDLQFRSCLPLRAQTWTLMDSTLSTLLKKRSTEVGISS